jgi:hypothetical protein
LYFDQQLEAARSDAIAHWVADPQNRNYNVQLRIQIYGRCKTGRFERTDISFELPPGAAGLRPSP